MHVRQLMTSPPKTIDFEESAHQAMKIMLDGDIGVLPVVDGARVVGIVTDRDIARTATETRKRLQDIEVAIAMSSRVWTCRPNDTIQHAEAVMRNHQIRRLPVVDTQGRIVGLLSLNDIAREAARSTLDIDRGDVVQTMSAIGEPTMHALQAR